MRPAGDDGAAPDVGDRVAADGAPDDVVLGAGAVRLRGSVAEADAVGHVGRAVLVAVELELVERIRPEGGGLRVRRGHQAVDVQDQRRRRAGRTEGVDVGDVDAVVRFRGRCVEMVGAADEERGRPHCQREPGDGEQAVARGSGVMDERIECVTSLCAPAWHRPLVGVAHPRSDRINPLHSGGGRHWIRHAAGRVRHARGTGRVREVEPAARAGRPADRGRLRRRRDARARIHAAGRAGPPARPRHRAEDRPHRPRGRAPVRRVARAARARGHPPGPRARRPRRLRPLHRLLDGVPGRRLRRAARRAGGGPAVRDRRARRPTSRSCSTCPSRPGSPASPPRSPGSRRTRTSRTTSASATGSSSFAAADPDHYAIVDATLDEASRARRGDGGARAAGAARRVPADDRGRAWLTCRPVPA